MHPHVQSALEQAHARYTVRRHAELPAPIRSPQDFAQALGYPIERITKSLFVRCQGRDSYAIAVCSVNKKLDLVALAARVGCKRLEIAGRAELRERTGYPPTGVSPLGVGAIPIFMDEGLLQLPTVLIGAGEVGVEVEIGPADLRDIVGATVLPLAAE